jgi:alcohol dehydrogenase (cytochrome c)
MRKQARISILLAASAAAQVRYEDIRKSPNTDWLTYAGDYASMRHSPLRQITVSNVSSLVAKWVYKVEGAKKLEVSPIVYRGVMYITDTNHVQALEARTGRRIWQYRAPGQGTRVNRGVAILENKVFLVTSDCHVVALNRVTGGVVWDHEYASSKAGYSSSMAPLAVKDKILVGVAGGGSGQRGFVAALAAADGHEVWRFWTVPGKGEPGSETWGGFPAETGGAPTWTTGSFDPDLNLVYWPTGNPWPDFAGHRRPGDNLYSDCVVALDPDTGKLKWHFQFTPHDVWDWDANETPVLIDAEWKGRMRKLLLHADRNGFYYVLDRVTGEYLHGTPFVERLTWAKGLDAKGRPVVNPNMEPSTGGRRICPSVRGAANWMSPSYNPATGLLYVVTLEQCDIMTTSQKEPIPSSGFRGTGNEGIPAEPGEFYLRALDARTGAIKWQYRMPGPGTMWAGTVSTAGGLVFTGDDDGNLVALDSRTGTDLWHFSTGQTLYASPITFEVDGKQYVTIAGEADIFTFGLFEPAPSPARREQ